jgi:hypothetical protein
MRTVFSAIVLWIAIATATAANWDFPAVQKRIHELQPTPAEKRFDQIGWAKDIREARRLASQHNRPVFLFTHDGRMNIGRC